MPGAILIALPFDRDSLLRLLESRAVTPRPHVAELDSLYAASRQPFAALSGASARISSIRDSMLRPRTDTARLRSELSRSEADLAQARRQVDAIRGAIGPRIDSLRRDVTRWENSTYSAYESLAAPRIRGGGRQGAVPDTTGPDGWAHVRVPPGRWWISSTSWDVSDPNRYWYWNLPVTGDTMRLDSRNGTRRPRY